MWKTWKTWKTCEKPHLPKTNCLVFTATQWSAPRWRYRRNPHWVHWISWVIALSHVTSSITSRVWVSFNIFRYLSISSDMFQCLDISFFGHASSERNSKSLISFRAESKCDLCLWGSLRLFEALWGTCLFKRSNEDTAPTWPRSVSMHLPSCELRTANSWINVWDYAQSTCVHGMDLDSFRMLYLHVY